MHQYVKALEIDIKNKSIDLYKH